MSTPVFAKKDGRMTTKKRMIATMQAIYNMTCGIMLVLSGHSLRRTGAQYLARLGLELALIQLLGRWGSATIERYVAETPLAKIAAKTKELIRTKSLTDYRLKALEMMTERSAASSSSTDGPTTAVGKQVAEEISNPKVNEEIADLKWEISILRQMVADDIDNLGKQVDILRGERVAYVYRTSRRRTHVVRVGPPAKPKSWRADCGWCFAFSRFALTHEPLPLKCLRCFKEQRTDANDTLEDGTTSSAGSSGSSGA